MARSLPLGGCQAGLINNLNDGLAWGLFPLYFAACGLGVTQIGLLADRFGVPWAIAGIAALTFASGVFVLLRMRETLQTWRPRVKSA